MSISNQMLERFRQRDEWWVGWGVGWVEGVGGGERFWPKSTSVPMDPGVWPLCSGWLHTMHLNTQIYTQACLQLLSRNIRHTAHWHHYSWCEFNWTQPQCRPPPQNSQYGLSLSKTFFNSLFIFFSFLLSSIETIVPSPRSLCIEADLLWSICHVNNTLGAWSKDRNKFEFTS